MIEEEKDKKKDKKKDGEEERSYTGTKDPVDRAFAEWIARQWRRGESLQRIEVIEYHPKGAMKGFGSIVDFEIFTAARDVNLEEAVDLSHRFLGSAQINCDRIHKRDMTYYVRAFDRGRQPTSEPVDTFPIFLRPKTVYAVDKPGGDEDDVTERSVALQYLQETRVAYQWDRQREDTNVGEILGMLINERREMRTWMVEQQEMIRRIMEDWVQAIRDREAALSAELDRLPAREMTKIKAEILRDGWRSGKNLLTGALGGMIEDKKNEKDAPNGEVVERRMTEERMHIDNFFQDCKNAKIDAALFGAWEKDPDGPKVVKEGIFTPDQFRLLAQVLTGHLRADALDDLLPDSGRSLAITMDQLRRAQSVEGMTEGIAASVIQLLKIRTRKRAETRKTAETATPAAPNPTPIPTEENADV